MKSFWLKTFISATLGLDDYTHSFHIGVVISAFHYMHIINRYEGGGVQHIEVVFRIPTRILFFNCWDGGGVQLIMVYFREKHAIDTW